MEQHVTQEKTIFGLEQRRTLFSKFVATVALAIDGAAFVLLTIVLVNWPDIPGLIRYLAMLPLAVCLLFAVTGLAFLWSPTRPYRVYKWVERAFVVVILLALSTLTSAVVWRAFAD